MIKKGIKFEKDGTVIEFPFVFCECGNKAELKGSSGCPHDGAWTYFFQCPHCKNIGTFDYCVERESEEALVKAGWKRSYKTK